MGNFVFQFNCITRLAVAATLAAGLAAAPANAQNSDGHGNWGAEGRIGSGQSAYLLRWFDQNWSLVLGGGVTGSSSENTSNTATNTVHSGNLQALVRREWGAGRVRPFVSAGPQLSFSRSVNESSTGAGASKITGTNIGLGGRGEFGAFATVNESVGLGIILGATAGRNEAKTKASGSATETKSTSSSFSIGSPQFAVRVRF